MGGYTEGQYWLDRRLVPCQDLGAVTPARSRMVDGISIFNAKSVFLSPPICRGSYRISGTLKELSYISHFPASCLSPKKYPLSPIKMMTVFSASPFFSNAFRIFPISASTSEIIRKYPFTLRWYFSGVSKRQYHRVRFSPVRMYSGSS